jgi:hypothetical protein
VIASLSVVATSDAEEQCQAAFVKTLKTGFRKATGTRFFGKSKSKANPVLAAKYTFFSLYKIGPNHPNLDFFTRTPDWAIDIKHGSPLSNRNVAPQPILSL